jgi:hypothetical protein
MIGAMTVIIAGAIVLAAVLAGIAVRFLRRDEVFVGLTPGLLPAPGQEVGRQHVRRSQLPPVAVRFNPPDGVGPGLAGVAIDGRVDPVELSATLIDLAQRGWLTLQPLAHGHGSKPYDWQLYAAPEPPKEPLTPTEQALLGAAFGAGPVTTLSAFRKQPGVKEASDTLLGEAADRHWLRHLATASSWSLTSAGPVLIVIGLAALFWFNAGFIGIGIALGGGAFHLLTRKLPEPLSAEGYAVRVQCEGFKQYLATAEAEQLKFEVGIDTFSRYLPYAMVFGVVDHWRSVFAEALRADPSGELDAFDWLVLGDMMQTAMILDLFSTDFGIFDSLTTEFADFADLSDLSGITEGIGDIFDGFDGGD